MVRGLVPLRRLASTRAPVKDPTMKNYAVGGGLLLFTAGVYAYSIQKIKLIDELGALEEAEDTVNAHASGLKVSRPRSLHDAMTTRVSPSTEEQEQQQGRENK